MSPKQAASPRQNGPERQHFCGSDIQLEVLYAVAQVLSRAVETRDLPSDILVAIHTHLGLEEAPVMVAADAEGLTRAVGFAASGGEGTKNFDEQRRSALAYRAIISGDVLAEAVAAGVPGLRLLREGQSESITPALIEFYAPLSRCDTTLGALSMRCYLTCEACVHALKHLLKTIACMAAAPLQGCTRPNDADGASTTVAGQARRNRGKGAAYKPSNIVGTTRAMRDVYKRIDQIAQTDATVLIRGESGTGKQLVAEAIHRYSNRAHAAFVRVDCSQLNEDRLKSDWFDHEKGTLTGGAQLPIGCIEEAHNGTLFLDEIGDLCPAMQAKLLRVEQERSTWRVGSGEGTLSNVRIICSTKRPLEPAIEEDVCQRDSHDDVNVFSIHLPALRERLSDIPALANHFVDHFASRMGLPIKRISTTAIDMMVAYHWPGNVRELENCIEHAVLHSEDGVVHGRCLPPTLQMPEPTDGTAPVGTLRWHTRRLERDIVTDALKRHNGKVVGAAAELGLTPRMVRYKLKSMGIVNTKR